MSGTGVHGAKFTKNFNKNVLKIDFSVTGETAYQLDSLAKRSSVPSTYSQPPVTLASEDSKSSSALHGYPLQIHVQTYTIYVHTQTQMCMYTHMHIYIHVYKHICTYTHIHRVTHRTHFLIEFLSNKKSFKICSSCTIFYR